jgi:uncharacterized protein YprB with RNaseH-like and TPR domain
MRNLSQRLREIVRNNSGDHFSKSVKRSPESFSYSADGVEGIDLKVAAQALGGALHQSGASTCIVIDRTWDPDHWHGRGRISSFAPQAQAPIGLFDPRVAAVPEWARRPVFFDIETTGLSGGAGTLPFLVGCGWFDDDGGFQVRQFFLAGPAGEHAMLQALAAIFDDASLLITFNGRTFDVPLMETRWAFHRSACPTDDLPQFDMLPPARRLWGRRDEEDASCRLSALERAVLRFHRVDDVPGIEIPARYFHFLRTGDAGAIEGVIEHNRHDLISLAAIVSRALWLAHEGADAATEPAEQLALGRLYERADDIERAAHAYELAARPASAGPIRAHALACLAVLRRRQGRHADAAAAWQEVIVLAAEDETWFTSEALERQAAEALAIHHEHRARDLAAARRYAQSLRKRVTGRAAADLDHRLGRIERKIQATEDTLKWEE